MKPGFQVLLGNTPRNGIFRITKPGILFCGGLVYKEVIIPRTQVKVGGKAVLFIEFPYSSFPENISDELPPGSGAAAF